VLHVLASVGQSDPQASGLGGLVGLFRVLDFLRFLHVLVYHPVVGLMGLGLAFALAYALIAVRKARSERGGGIPGPPEGESSLGGVQKEVQGKRPPTSGSPEAEADEKCTKVRCSHCQHVQAVPVSQKTFSCEQCKAHLKRRTAPAESS
jgi:hypothetical protein